MELLSILLQILIFIIITSSLIFSSYLKKKGENFATKKDISEITQKIEEVKTTYNSQLEILKSSLQLSNQLRLAILDKRFEKHQEAFTLWFNFFGSLYDEDKKIREAINACQKWWNNNCLYLDEESRKSFKSAFLLASTVKRIPNTDIKNKKKYYSIIQEAGQKIVKAIDLPPISEEEFKKVDIQKSS